jgi:NAD+ kinase
MTELRRIGLVVHPTRDAGEPLDAVRAWARDAEVELTQVPVAVPQREVAPPGEIDRVDLVVAVGGDGTALAAMREAVRADRPLLGIACGSLGVLTTIVGDQIPDALTRFRDGQWHAKPLPALQLSFEDREGPFALNDVAIVRAGEGQVRTIARVEGAVFARFAGDGCIVSTPVGASAYALAAGGPLMMPGADAFLLTPLSVHGGFAPPLVLSGSAELQLEITTGYGGARLEVDGQVDGPRAGTVTIRLRHGVARAVSFDGQESFLAGLRRRQIIIDSPRILAEDGRS